MFTATMLIKIFSVFLLVWFVPLNFVKMVRGHPIPVIGFILMSLPATALITLYWLM